MKNNNNSRKYLSVPIVDVFIILLILAGVILGALKLFYANGDNGNKQYRVDVIIKDADGNAMRVSNGTALYFEDGTVMGTAKLFGSNIYDTSQLTTFNASVLINGDRRPDALYCGGVPLLIGDEITLHSKNAVMTAVIVSWSEIGDDNS